MKKVTCVLTWVGMQTCFVVHILNACKRLHVEAEEFKEMDESIHLSSKFILPSGGSLRMKLGQVALPFLSDPS